MSTPLRLLLLEDNPSDAELAVSELRRAGFEPDWARVETEADFLAALNPALDLIVADYRLPQFDGLRALELLVERGLDIPFILVSGAIGEERAVEAMKKGAADYLLKDRLARLAPAVERELAQAKIRRERQQAEAAVAASHKRFLALVENAPDAISLIGVDGTIVYDSPAALRLLGYETGELMGHNAFALIHPDDLPLVTRLFQQVIQDPSARVNGLFRFQHKDGSWRWIEATASNLLAELSVQAVVINYRDITKRQQAEAALRESEARYRLLFEQNPLPMWVYDTATLRFLAVNSAAIEHYGYERDEFWAMTIKDIRPPEELPLLQDNVAQTRQPRERSGPWKHRKKDGTLIDVEIISHDTLFLDRSARLVLANDITERQQAEESLHHRLAELEALHTISTALRIAQTRDEALPILLDETLAALETDAGIIWLYHPEGNELRRAVARGWFKQLAELPMTPGQGIAGTVFASGQAHISPEFAHDPLVIASARPQIPTGWGGICLPIRSSTGTVGVLFVSVPLPRQITGEQITLLESLTEMASAALHRMSLHEETVRRADQLEALHNIDLAITASVDLRLTLNVLLEQVTRQLNVDAACVLLLNPHMQTLEYTAGRGFQTSVAQTARVRLGESFAGRAALERHIVQIVEPAQIHHSPHFAALWAGEGFAAYFGVPLIAKGEVKGVLEIFHRSPLDPMPEWLSFLETLGGQAAIAIDNAQLFDNLQRSNLDLTLAYDATIEGWSRALDLRDKETEGHTQRVTELTLRLTQPLGLSEVELVHVRRGALLHDIGKMGVPDSILLKAGSLTDDEWKIMRRHPQLAHDLLAPIAYLRPALDIPYYHHEKWDGTGYPHGLKGEQIPLAARLFAVVDVWDALRSDRPYRPAWPKEKVLEHIRSQAGTHFDPRVVDVFLSLMDKD